MSGRFLPLRNFALRLQRPPGGSLRDIRVIAFGALLCKENTECVFPFAALSLRNRCAPGGALSHPSRAEYLVEVFQEPSLAETAGEREGSDVAEHVAPGYW